MALTSPRFADSDRLQAASTNNPPLRAGETGDAVMSLQEALFDLGFPLPISFPPGGGPDGIYGDETTGAVRQFQVDQGFPTSGQDGVAGRDTLTRLDSLFPPATPGSARSCWRPRNPVRSR